MVSSCFTLQLLLAVGAAVAAPIYFDNESVYSREVSSLNLPETRSIMLENQVYTRGYGDDVKHIARDVSESRFGIRSDSENDQPSMGATNQEKLDWHMKQAEKGKNSVEAAKATHKAMQSSPIATKKEKSAAQNNLHTAKESLDEHTERIEFYEAEIKKENP